MENRDIRETTPISLEDDPKINSTHTITEGVWEEITKMSSKLDTDSYMNENGLDTGKIKEIEESAADGVFSFFDPSFQSILMMYIRNVLSNEKDKPDYLSKYLQKIQSGQSVHSRRFVIDNGEIKAKNPNSEKEYLMAINDYRDVIKAMVHKKGLDPNNDRYATDRLFYLDLDGRIQNTDGNPLLSFDSSTSLSKFMSCNALVLDIYKKKNSMDYFLENAFPTERIINSFQSFYSNKVHVCLRNDRNLKDIDLKKIIESLESLSSLSKSIASIIKLRIGIKNGREIRKSLTLENKEYNLLESADCKKISESITKLIRENTTITNKLDEFRKNADGIYPFSEINIDSVLSEYVEKRVELRKAESDFIFENLEYLRSIDETAKNTLLDNIKRGKHPYIKRDILIKTMMIKHSEIYAKDAASKSSFAETEILKRKIPVPIFIQEFIIETNNELQKLEYAPLLFKRPLELAVLVSMFEHPDNPIKHLNMLASSKNQRKGN